MSDFKRLAIDPAFKRKWKPYPKLNPVAVPRDETPADTTLNELVRRLGGDRALAKRVRALQDKFPVGTVPELVVYSWLQQQGYSFEYQVELYGGRGIRGGLIPDFLLRQDGSNGDIWQVEGDYFHSIARKGFHDQTAKWRMLGQIIRGVTVKRVISLWESDLYLHRPQIFYWALAGLEMRGIGGV